ncbi:hypothetical protein SCHPADRAFT_909584 [Schizopora paradoxa]|uniref:MYND-type domain-containing protein n=1 Tax=Schizopora paradoxa TaxID=27342 RepID=A0A0H2R637_9AGAM|nr:hypothetical protein SCHPADRAFT_909584 [Schizopora paradoxa]
MEKLVEIFEKSSSNAGSKEKIRRTLSAAAKGSVKDLRAVSDLGSLMRPGYMPEAFILFCSFLDAPAPDPQQRFSTPSQRLTRDLALLSLVGICGILGPGSAPRPAINTFVYNWSKILNWIRYFGGVATDKTSPNPPDPALRLYIFTFMNFYVTWISQNRRALFEGTILNGGLLDIIVKVWLATEDTSITDSSDNPRWVAHLYDGLVAASKLNKQNEGQMDKARKVVLDAVGGDASVVAKQLLRHLHHPTKINKENTELVNLVNLFSLLTIKSPGVLDGVQTVFSNAFLKNDIVPLTAKLLSFVVEDITRSDRRKALEEGTYVNIIRGIMINLQNCEQALNGMQWAVAMFKLGFLRSLAILSKYPQYLGSASITTIKKILIEDLPQYFVHRFVVIAAIRAAKEISLEGLTQSLESGPLAEHWSRFESVLLDRTVFNAIYQRDFAEIDDDECFTCKRSKKQLQAPLFKCAGCEVATYCSKECQTTAWKRGNHKEKCKQMRDPWFGFLKKKSAPSGFLQLLGAFELHRHLPGLMEQISKDFDLDTEKPFQNSLLILNFGRVPPVACLETVETVAGFGSGAGSYFQLVANLLQQAKGAIIGVDVMGDRGGEKAAEKPFFLPYTFLDTARGIVYDPGEAKRKFSDLTRMPAIDKKGRGLRFVLDEIDIVVLEAREHFRAPSPGDTTSAGSPKTIYDYIERVVARRQRDPWTDCLYFNDLLLKGGLEEAMRDGNIHLFT